MRSTFITVIAMLLALSGTRQFAAAQETQPGEESLTPAEAAKREAALLRRTRQVTFEGQRAGEGYFSANGSQLVFQSEREPGNPFYQIYLMNLDTGDVERVSPGQGKTTCAWIHPDGRRVLFASTHDDPAAVEKQKEEIAIRESGKERRYAWDYDEHYELYERDPETGEFKNLTNARGYDAEGSWSPDGSLIAFASNRNAYTRKLNAREQELFDRDPAWAMDIFIMNADGSNVRQLTDVPGYDGGPFFSPDGKRICWRRFAENGLTAEVMTMKIDGTDVRQLTRIGAMSWAPYYHPSGDYLIFTTNRHGFANFELYIVRADGAGEPARVTWTDRFDGLPVFTPDGKRLAWTSQRSSSGNSQIFMAEWSHAKARQLLSITDVPGVKVAGRDRLTRPEFAPADIVRHVGYLCRPELGGRGTGTKGELLATQYVATYLEDLGLKPAGTEGWFQKFEFTAGAALGDDNSLAVGATGYELEKDWRPVAFSANGAVEPAPVVFAGYGIVAPKTGDQEEYDSYVHLDVKDKWVAMLRFLPEDISAERRQHLSRHASLRYKVMQARDRGARGVVLISGPTSQARNELVPLQFDGSLAGTSIPVVSVSDRLAHDWLTTADKSLQKLQSELDAGGMMMGILLKDVQLQARIDVRKVRRSGRNVIGRLQFGEKPSDQVIVIGAHIDHLGTGPSSSSLARDEERDGIHFGADDNASGVAAMLEVAEYLADNRDKLAKSAKRDVLFAAWSGEELGLIGSAHFVKTYGGGQAHAAHGHGTAAGTKSAGHSGGQPSPHAPPKHGAAAAHSSAHAVPGSVYPAIAACLNMDMVGRMEDKLVLQGIGSSSIWKSEIERRNAVVGLSLTLQSDSYLPTDASSFFMRGVPILSAFTGSHSDYHTPRDTPEKLNYDGAAKIARFMALVARALVIREKAPDYVAQSGPEEGQRRANLRAWLGTAPDYAEGDVKGVLLSGVSANSPAAKAGIRGGDVIVELAGRKIENIYDYTYAIEALKIGKEVSVAVMREGKRVSLKITPGSRD